LRLQSKIIEQPNILKVDRPEKPVNDTLITTAHCENTIQDQSFDDSSIISEKSAKPVTELKETHKIVLVSGSHQIGKISERHPKCEDAFFITENAFGLSDGVSGWNDYGFSSDEFSKQLMSNAKIIIDKKWQKN
jgi:hypothetical protein